MSRRSLVCGHAECVTGFPCKRPQHAFVYGPQTNEVKHLRRRIARVQQNRARRRLVAQQVTERAYRGTVSQDILRNRIGLPS